MMPWTVDEALQWADNFGLWKGETPGGDAMALAALAAEVRRLNNALAYAKDGLERAATAIEKSLYDEALLHCGHHKVWAARALIGTP